MYKDIETAVKESIIDLQEDNDKPENYNYIVLQMKEIENEIEYSIDFCEKMAEHNNLYWTLNFEIDEYKLRDLYDFIEWLEDEIDDYFHDLSIGW